MITTFICFIIKSRTSFKAIHSVRCEASDQVIYNIRYPNRNAKKKYIFIELRSKRKRSRRAAVNFCRKKNNKIY